MSGLLFENNKHAIAKVRENANRITWPGPRPFQGWSTVRRL